MRATLQRYLLPALLGIGAIAGAIGEVVTHKPPGADITLPGSPLYTMAVTESVRGQSGEKEPAPEPKPCPICGQIHAQSDPYGPGHSAPFAAVSSDYVYCTNCKAYHRVMPKIQIGSLPTAPGSIGPP